MGNHERSCCAVNQLAVDVNFECIKWIKAENWNKWIFKLDDNLMGAYRFYTI